MWISFFPAKRTKQMNVERLYLLTFTLNVAKWFNSLSVDAE